MSEECEILAEFEDGYPWEDVDEARADRRLQRKHPIAEGQDRYRAVAKACPKCNTAADRLSWFYFRSPALTWEPLCGRAGWMTVCDQCHVQVDFFCEVMS